MNGGKLIVKLLESLGVKYIFGYIGASVAPIFDALIDSDIKLINSVDEVGATHMADGYARATGLPGVVLATSGPGATNLITGIATAYMDSVPLLAITANVPANKLGKDSFQEVDIVGIATPITKYARIVKSIAELESELVKGYISAGSGRKAPVLLDITGNVFDETADINNVTYIPNAIPAPSLRDIDSATSLINASKQPLILVGGGATNAIEQINALAEKLNAPIASTMRAAGASDSELYIGTVGAAAPFKNNKIYRSADLIIAFGTRFSNRNHSIDGKKQKLIHVDIDQAELNKIVIADVAIHSEATAVLELLLPKIQPNTQKVNCVHYDSPLPKGRLKKLAHIVSDLADGSFNLATDVGVHQVEILNALRYIDQTKLITSAGLGTMGFGIGAAIGSYFGNKLPVLLIAGDGGFNMSARELISAVKYNVPLTVVIINNHSLKMIENIQNKKFNGRHIAIDTPQIAYKALAKSYGAKGATLKLGTASTQLHDAINSGKVTVFEFITR